MLAQIATEEGQVRYTSTWYAPSDGERGLEGKEKAYVITQVQRANGTWQVWARWGRAEQILRGQGQYKLYYDGRSELFAEEQVLTLEYKRNAKGYLRRDIPLSLELVLP